MMASTAGCPHVLRYFSAWFEDDYLFIQTEICEGTIAEHRRGMGACTEKQILDFVKQVRG